MEKIDIYQWFSPNEEIHLGTIVSEPTNKILVSPDFESLEILLSLPSNAKIRMYRRDESRGRSILQDEMSYDEFKNHTLRKISTIYTSEEQWRRAWANLELSRKSE